VKSSRKHTLADWPRLAATAAALSVAGLLLVACGGTGGSTLPSGSLTLPAGEAPSLSVSVPSREEPTRPEAPTRTAEPPNPVTTTNRPVTTTEAPRTTTKVEAAPSAAPATATADSTGVPSWVWWLLGALVAVVAIAVPLLLRANRRRRWQTDFQTAEAEAAWFARALIPELRRAGSPDQLAGAWAVGSSRVSALEDRLTALEATAPDEDSRARARRLRNPVRHAHGRLNALITTGDVATLWQDLDPATAEIEAALTAVNQTW
jgi:hypothetical protein